MALRSGDPELRPTGTRMVWLDDFELSDELWASFQIPIGLAFFLDSTTAGGIVAFYPSPAGSMESELDLDAWRELAEANPVLESLDADGEALLVNRISDPPAARDRPDRRVLPTGRPGQGRAGRGSRAAAAPRRRSPASSTSCARGARRHEPADGNGAAPATRARPPRRRGPRAPRPRNRAAHRPPGARVLGRGGRPCRARGGADPAVRDRGRPRRPAAASTRSRSRR